MKTSEKVREVTPRATRRYVAPPRETRRPKEGTGKGERVEEFQFGHVPGLPGGKSRDLQQVVRNKKLGTEEDQH